MGGGPPSFPPDSSCLVVLRISALFGSLRIRGYHPLRRRLSIRSSTRSPPFFAGPYPHLHFCRSVWALPRSLAATYGIECFFLFLRVLRCFSSPRLPPLSYLFHLTVTALSWLPGSPIRTSAALRLFAPTRGFSQLVTSFFGSQCQGIPPALLVA